MRQGGAGNKTSKTVSFKQAVGAGCEIWIVPNILDFSGLSGRRERPLSVECVSYRALNLCGHKNCETAWQEFFTTVWIRNF
jgi:hypothetical protein